MLKTKRYAAIVGGNSVTTNIQFNFRNSKNFSSGNTATTGHLNMSGNKLTDIVCLGQK